MTAQPASEGAEEQVEAHQQPKQPHLAFQDASKVDPKKLTALTPEVVSGSSLSPQLASSYLRSSCWKFLGMKETNAAHSQIIHSHSRF